MKVLTTSICNGGENETSCEKNEHDSYTTDRRNATRTAAATATMTTLLKSKQKIPDTLQGSERCLRSSGSTCRSQGPREDTGVWPLSCSSGSVVKGLGRGLRVVKHGVWRQEGVLGSFWGQVWSQSGMVGAQG